MMERQITIAVHIKDREMQGQWLDAADGAPRDITVNGKSVFPLRDAGAVWAAVASNLQLDTRREACRLLLASDQPVDDAVLPSWNCSWDWTLEDAAQAVTRQGPVGKWIINGTDLQGRFAGFFPVSSGAQCCWVRTLPFLTVPEGGDSTPLAKIIQGMNQNQSGAMS